MIRERQDALGGDALSREVAGDAHGFDPHRRGEWAPGWVDLIGAQPGQRILLCSPAPDRAVARLSAIGAAVTAIAPASTPPPGRWPLVVADRALPAGPLRAVLEPGGRLFTVMDSGIGRLMRRRPLATTGHPTAAMARRRLADDGLALRHRLALFPSAEAAVTAFDVTANGLGLRVIEPLVNIVRGSRREPAFRALAAALRRAPWSATTLAPAWLFEAGAGDLQRDDQRRTGRIGLAISRQAIVMIGTGPDAVEKSYIDPGQAAAEHEALVVLAAAGFDRAPQPLGRPRPTTVRMSWLPGRVLDVSRLSDTAVLTWVERSITLLADLQRTTRRPDGSVLVHGDYWLGNLLVDGERITGVVDWPAARWGDHAVDPAKLVQNLGRPHLDGALQAIVARGMGSAR